MQLSTEFWVQILAYACSFAAVYGRLMVRIQYLEQKMDKHNNLWNGSISWKPARKMPITASMN